MPSDSPRPAAVTPGVPTFTPAELHKQLDAVLGKGASGTVYSLRDFPGLAAKEILLDGLDQHSIDAAKLELTTLPALSHPGILRYHQVIENDSFIYIVMDRHDGTLECLLIEHKRKKTHVSNRLVCSIARQIAAALAYLSSAIGVDAKGRPLKGLVHRDLKPINILVAADGEQFILADFGLCKDALRSGSTVAGTKPYMAPETLIYNSTTPATDIWALGVIIYELATLKRPNFLEGKEPKDVFIDGWKPDLSDVKNDFIRSIIERIFILDPKKRPTAKELADIFQAPSDSPEGQGSHTTAWEAALDNANARIATLEREFQINLSKINFLESTITAQIAEMDVLKKELNTKSTKICALEQQFTRAIEALEEKTHRRETEMDQQLAQVRAEADQHKKELETLKLANEYAEEATQAEEALASEGVDNNGVTALMKAAIRDDVEVVQVLVTKQKRLGDRDGKTALMYAAQRDCKETVKVLLEYEKRIRDNQNHNALYHALKSGHMEVAEVIIPHEDPTDENGVTALMRAAARGDAEMVELLIPIQKGMKDKDGNTAFMHALKNKHVDVAMLLRNHEAPSWTPLMCAAAAGDIKAAKKHLSDKDKKNDDGDTAYTLAAKAGQGTILELLDPTDKNGVTALMRAAERDDMEAVRALMHLQKRRAAKCVMINGRSASHGTALMMAAACGHADVVELLVEYEGGMKDTTGQTALMFATNNGHIECVRLLVDREGGIKENKGETALMFAALNGHGECVKLLLEEACMQDNDGVTALMYAAQQGHEEVVKVLLEHEKGIVDNKGNTAFMHALKNKHTDIAPLLRECEAPSWTLLMCAAFVGDIEIVKQYLSDKDTRNIDGDTALILAAKAGHRDVVELLDPTDWNGVTALMQAAERGDTEAVGALIPLQRKRRADRITINGWDIHRGTALMIAVVSGYTEIVKLLIEEEGGMKDDNGTTALMFATNNGHTECLKLLLEKESGMKDKDGWTALMSAAQNGYAGCVRLLLEKEGGMQKTGICNKGKTALMVAAEYGHLECVKLLIEKEAYAQDNRGWTALMWAIYNNKLECARLLAKKENDMKTTHEWNGYPSGTTALDVAKERGHTEIASILSK